MTDLSFPARYTAAKNMLTNTVQNLFDQYTATQNTSASLIAQNNDLQLKVNALKAKLKAVKTAVDTYDREFVDRSAGKRTRSYFQQHGLHTLQDWLLFLFFVFYAFICVSLFGVVVYYANNKMSAGIKVVLFSFILGVMIAGMITRFA
jgi:RsiW-degrading membrane proteinase PrsW (M82 family)